MIPLLGITVCLMTGSSHIFHIRTPIARGMGVRWIRLGERKPKAGVSHKLMPCMASPKSLRHDDLGGKGTQAGSIAVLFFLG